MIYSEEYQAYWLDDQTWLFETMDYNDVLITWRNLLTGQYAADLVTSTEAGEIENKIEKAVYARIGTKVDDKFMVWFQEGDEYV